MTIAVALHHAFGGFAIDVAFDVAGGVVALAGPSGAGKSSVLKIIAGLIVPRDGRISINGKVLLDTATGLDIPRHSRRIGFVFQEPRLFPHLTVRQNLAYGRWFAPKGGEAIGFGAAVDLLGIGHLLARKPAALSGGEQQRVAIGRALLANPRLLLLDEPLASVDEARRADIIACIERIRDGTDIPIIYVSHASEEVARLADVIVTMAGGKVTGTTRSLR